MGIRKNNVISSFSKKKIVGAFIALALGFTLMPINLKNQCMELKI
jgi:hypothetical protein